MGNSYNAVKNLEQTIGSFKSKVDVKIDTVNTSTVNIKSTTEKIYNSISKFKSDMIQNEEKQLAHENIIRIEQVLKEQFGNHEELRKTVLGVVKNFDINLVRNSTIQEISEELWITSSRYWLSYALIAISAWVNDYTEIAKNALAEGVRRDNVKSTLFFCLMNLRFARNEVAKKWFFEYLKTLDPTVMKQESAVLLQSYLNGIFGTDKELEYEVNKVIQRWITELNAHKEITEELVGSYKKYIELTPSHATINYIALPEFCDEIEGIKRSYCNIAKYDTVIEYIDSLNVELQEQNEANYKSRIDGILMSLITNYDQEELELKNQQAYFKFIIDNDGRIDAAEEQYEEYQNLQSENFNIGKQMVKWAVYDETTQTDVHVKKFGLQNTKVWFKEAVENWAMMLQENFPLDYSLKIDTWSGVSNGEDQAEQIESMNQYYNNNKFQMLYVNTYNIAALLLLIVSMGLIFVTPYSLVATALAVGFLLFRIIKANKDYPKRINASLQNLKNCMTELADFREFYHENKAKKDKLLSNIEYL